MQTPRGCLSRTRRTTRRILREHFVSLALVLGVTLSICGTGNLAAALGDSATRFNVFVPPNNAYSSRRSILVVTNSSTFSNVVTIQDDATDGDDDDSVVVTLERGQSYITRISEGAVNDDFGGKMDGDYLHIVAANPVTVHMATQSNWQHDWAASTEKRRHWA